MRILGNRLLIEPLKPKTNGLIARPQLSEEKPAIGKVLLIGSGSKIDPLLVPGATVRVDTNYGSVDVPYEGRPCRIVSSTDVQLVLG